MIVGSIWLSHHQRGAPDPKSFLPIASQKCPKRLLCNAPHQALASTHYSGVRFQFSHPRVVWLPGFRKSRIGQLDSVHIRELRRIARPRQEHHHSPTRFHSKPESGSLRHLVLNVTGTVTCHPWLGADFHCRSVLIAA